LSPRPGVILYDANGERAEKLTVGWVGGTWLAIPGFIDEWPGDGDHGAHVFGFRPERSFEPRFMAVRMGRGYRLLLISRYSYHSEYFDAKNIDEWWEAASEEHKRFPTIAALEMWIRHVGVNQ
jgi:hypothetical protein